MADQRLPYVDGDDGDWGDILNQFLEKEHYNTASNNPANGGHQTVTIRAGEAAAGKAPLKFDPDGTLLAVPEAGALEVEGEHIYYSGKGTGTTRRVLPGYDSAGSAPGDMYYRRADNGNLESLAIGTPGSVLTANADSEPEWAAPTGISRSINSVSTNTAAGSTPRTDYVYNVTGSTTITLPVAGTAMTNQYTIRNAGTSPVTIATTAGNTINGAASPLILQFQNSSVDLISDGSGSNWSIA